MCQVMSLWFIIVEAVEQGIDLIVVAVLVYIVHYIGFMYNLVGWSWRIKNGCPGFLLMLQPHATHTGHARI